MAGLNGDDDDNNNNGMNLMALRFNPCQVWTARRKIKQAPPSTNVEDMKYL